MNICNNLDTEMVLALNIQEFKARLDNSSYRDRTVWASVFFCMLQLGKHKHTHTHTNEEAILQVR